VGKCYWRSPDGGHQPVCAGRVSVLRPLQGVRHPVQAGRHDVAPARLFIHGDGELGTVRDSGKRATQVAGVDGYRRWRVHHSRRALGPLSRCHLLPALLPTRAGGVVHRPSILRRTHIAWTGHIGDKPGMEPQALPLIAITSRR
jgi:hypothetical protein